MIEKLLQLFIRKVDTQLLKTVELYYLWGLTRTGMHSKRMILGQNYKHVIWSGFICDIT